MRERLVTDAADYLTRDTTSKNVDSTDKVITPAQLRLANY